ncbi:hypothetical protein [Azospirillum sp. A1-3]|uniref:O-linked N-acetylglucosamine transferase family protein n=1 Tax=Azospirillum sp. A1-3 TaxID=185874 RepID=UPI002572641B|nr:hypothetical protein [Azospirillum sp. A1-3]
MKADPKQPIFHANLGRLLEVAERWEEAATAFRNAARLAPLDLSPARMEAAVRTRLGQQGPADAGSAADLGDALYDCGRFLPAADWYGRAARLEPHRVLAAFNRGAALRDAGRPELAEAAFRALAGLAPLQVSLPLYPNTTGLSAVDYQIADPRVAPPGADALHVEKLHVEKLIRLPGCVLCYRPAESGFAPPDRPPMERNGYVTFGSFNNITKVNAATIALWARLLAAFARHGIGAERLELRGITPDPYQDYVTIDVALDPVFDNGGTTICDALWMGVPVLNQSGPTKIGRWGASMLDAVGMAELVTRDDEGYLAQGIRLATDRDFLDAQRERMRRSALMDEAGDFVMATPFLRGLRAAAPQARILLAVREAVADLAVTCRWVDGVIAPRPKEGGDIDFRGISPGGLKLFAECYRAGFDLALVPRYDFDRHGATTLAANSRARLVAGFSERVTPWKAEGNQGFDRAYGLALHPPPGRHEVEQNAALLEALGARPDLGPLELTLTAEDREEARVAVLGTVAERPCGRCDRGGAAGTDRRPDRRHPAARRCRGDGGRGSWRSPWIPRRPIWRRRWGCRCSPAISSAAIPTISTRRNASGPGPADGRSGRWCRPAACPVWRQRRIASPPSTRPTPPGAFWRWWTRLWGRWGKRIWLPLPSGEREGAHGNAMGGVIQGAMRFGILVLPLTLPTPSARVPSLSRGGRGRVQLSPSPADKS